MSKPCHICISPRRAEIELSVANGTPYKQIAEQYGTSPPAITRHTAAHIKQAARQQQAAREEAKTLDVLAQLRAINAVTLKILQSAKNDPARHELALKAIDRIQRQLELQARLLGDLDERPQVNVWLPAPWETIELAIAGALRPYPEAAVAVADALARVETGHAGLN